MLEVAVVGMQSLQNKKGTNWERIQFVITCLFITAYYISGNVQWAVQGCIMNGICMTVAISRYASFLEGGWGGGAEQSLSHRHQTQKLHIQSNHTHTHTHTHTQTPPHILTHTISCIYKASITQQAGIQINSQKYTLIIIQRRNYRHSFTLTNTHTHKPAFIYTDRSIKHFVTIPTQSNQCSIPTRVKYPFARLRRVMARQFAAAVICCYACLHLKTKQFSSHIPSGFIFHYSLAMI